jgi:hypothetical protein
MSQRIINIGTGPNTKDGDTVRQAFNLTNQNFTELYTLLGQTEDSVLSTSIKGSVWADDSTLVVDGINGKIYATDITTAQINLPNSIFTTTNSEIVPANTPTVVWTSAVTTITTAKLVIQVEGTVSSDANGSATWHTQICEAHVAKRANFTTAPAISVYGITYTSATALATFTTQYNVSTNKIEVIATATNAGYPLSVKIHATEIETSD